MIKNLQDYFVDCCPYDRYKQAKRCFHNWEEGIDCLEKEIEPQPIIYKTKQVNSYDICEGFDLYTIKETHYFSGYSLEEQEEYKVKINSALTEINSEECGYIPPVILYSSVTETQTACTVDYTKITIITTYKYSGYNGTDWILYDTIENREYLPNCEECGYIPPTPIEPIFSSTTETLNTCIGYDYYKITTTRYFSGYSEDEMEEYSASTNSTLIEHNSIHCGYEPPTPDVIYSSVTETTDECKGYDWYEIETTHYLSGYSIDTLVEYNSDIIERLIEENSIEHCGYEPPTEDCYVNLTFKDGTTSAVTIEDGIIKKYQLYHLYDCTDAVIGDCVIEIGQCSFEDNYNMSSVTIGNGVIGIYANAFSDCTSLTDVVIPDNVELIASAVFSGCTSLSSITIGSGCKTLGSGVFMDCTNLSSITIPNTVETIDVGLFKNCNKLKSVTIPPNVKIEEKTQYLTTGQNMFSGCTDLNNVDIQSEKIDVIGNDFFAYCTSLESVHLPKTITTLGDFCFNNCVSLKDIYFNGTINDWENINKVHDWNYKINNLCVVHCIDGDISIDGHIIKTPTIIKYTDGTTSAYTFDDSIIPTHWLSGRTDITEVEIGYNISEISRNAFYDCSKLTKATIPYSVKKFDGYIFGLCWDLEQIDYIGTINEWNAIEKSGGFHLGCPKLKIVHCLDGDIPIS